MTEKTEWKTDGPLSYPVTLTHCDGPDCDKVCYGPQSVGWIEVQAIGHDVRAFCDHPWGRTRGPIHFHRVACLRDYFKGAER